MQNFVLAASYIEDARLGRTLEYETDDTSLFNYRRYSNVYFQWGTIFILWFLLSLALFEDPAVEGASLPYWVGECFIHVVLSGAQLAFLRRVYPFEK